MAGEQKIHVSRALVDRLWQAKGGAAPPSKLMLAIRGATPFAAGGDLIVKTPNNPGFYNDTVGLVIGNQVLLYPGTTDAGSMAQIGGSSEDNPKGIFHLNDGIHRVRHHVHQAAKPIPPGLDSRKAWHVFTSSADANVHGWRDLNDTDVRDSGDTLDAVSDAINVHWGAFIKNGDALKTKVSINSVGCLNVMRDFWLTFRNMGYSQLPDPAALLVVDASLIPDPVVQVASLRISINQNDIPPALLNLWEEPPGKTVTYVRSFLDLLLVNGVAPQYVFKGGPDRLEFSVPANRQLLVKMKLENGANRGTAGIKDTLRALDPNIDVQRSVDENLIVVTSGVVSFKH